MGSLRNHHFYLARGLNTWDIYAEQRNAPGNFAAALSTMKAQLARTTKLTTAPMSMQILYAGSEIAAYLPCKRASLHR